MKFNHLFISLFSILLIIQTPSYAADDLDAMKSLLEHRIPGVKASTPEKTPLKGIYQTSFGAKYGYLIEGGRYVIIGDLIDLEKAKNLTEISRRDSRTEKMAQFDDRDMIIYPAKGETKQKITIFTDTSCPYCKKLHEEVGHLQEAGIQVQYLPFPRGSKRGPGYKELQKVWCAKDRSFAMHVAKGTEFGELLNDGKCEQADVVDKGFVVGNEVGVTGTPSIIIANGKKVDGYVPYKQLIPMVLLGR